MPDPIRDRSRLIDHFKRLYSIIVGLAITEGCKKLFPFNLQQFSSPSFWMFCALFVTVIPLFQGGDRSLDLKYLDSRDDGRDHAHFAFLWDVYMLLFTGLLLTFIAESIPAFTSNEKTDNIAFFYLMGFLFGFDVFVLIVDFLKSHVKNRLKPYHVWILINLILCILCFLVPIVHREHADISVSRIAFAIFVAACLRTAADYGWSKSFMFPGENHAEATGPVV